MTRFDDIQLLRVNYLRGPNIWTYRPVLEVWLDLGALEDFPSNKIDGFTDRLTALLPALMGVATLRPVEFREGYGPMRFAQRRQFRGSLGPVDTTRRGSSRGRRKPGACQLITS